MRMTARVLALGVIASLAGCASYAPPRAWEKHHLAKREMQFDADKLDAKNLQHIQFSKEASSGGYGVGGGGCGCN